MRVLVSNDSVTGYVLMNVDALRCGSAADGSEMPIHSPSIRSGRYGSSSKTH
jgi:hypothetical protein